MVTEMMLAVALGAQDPPGTHVRTAHREIVAFIEAGRARSATFCRLIAALDASDVIVYVEPKLTRPELGGFTNYKVVAVGRYRYLRIAIEIRGANSHVVPVLAHELQHAIEIADAPEARDVKGVEDVFRRLNRMSGPFDAPYSFETDAAIDIEGVVRSELMASPERATSGRPSPAILATQDPNTSHVRTTEPLVRKLIEQGLARSETFRRLVNTLNQSDVVVYIDPKITRQTLGAYLSHSVVSAGEVRYLHIAVALRGGDIRLVSLLAHELQHAVEVSQDPGARDSMGVARLFERLASTRGCGISNCEETEAALGVQAAVDAELKQR